MQLRIQTLTTELIKEFMPTMPEHLIKEVVRDNKYCIIESGTIHAYTTYEKAQNYLLYGGNARSLED